jgi:hypothetical protein
MIYGRRGGGRDHSIVHRALVNLFRMEVQFSGVDATTGEFETEFVALERLLVRLGFKPANPISRTGAGSLRPGLGRAEHDRTVEARFAEWHVRQMQNGYWVELDWQKLRSLNRAAKLLWPVLSSPRIPFRASEGAPHSRSFAPRSRWRAAGPGLTSDRYR